MIKKLAAIVISNNEENGFYKIEIQTNEPFKSFPGQFLSVFCKGHFLGIPFAFYQVISPTKFVILIKIFGRGSEIVSKFQKNSELEVLLPLGKPSNLVKDKRVFIIGAGVGIASIYELTKSLKEHNNVTVALGYKKPNEIAFVQDFKEITKNVEILCDETTPKATFIGNILEFLEKNINNFDYVYFCGGKKVTELVDKLLLKYEKQGTLMFENNMACGFGICNGCNISTKSGERKVCEDLNFEIGEVIY
ncbi:hypothetical protein ASO20_01465 [Mycoplasma sp. (ex Biomphalaria glabrata)]|uniref:iron-sulfur cluster-binding protein n=1 Tax=Mycoplasma sp. (ex Biomphalaria glabrata) TaxID=1749074 RepID=UPI00073A6F45|nr:hypothetical protein [Mycoplasma sp. (ex Biomphalaria glabrata)]ALV23319.1 hypothetical protein ASO20_01465 [Mycoplasma sp. (ex Biomphalaria glabrata)]